MKRILVTGGRDFGDADLVNKTLEDIAQRHSRYFMQARLTKQWWPHDIIIIHGAATGADELANQWALNRRAMIERHPADWTMHGDMAGQVRNMRMLLISKPDCVVAFPGNKGTAHMKRIARERGVPVTEIAACQ